MKDKTDIDEKFEEEDIIKNSEEDLEDTIKNNEEDLEDTIKNNEEDLEDTIKNNEEDLEDTIKNNEEDLEENKKNSTNILDIKNSKEYKELEEKYLREYADFHNIKKRLKSEQLEAIKHANKLFAADIITILDTLYISLPMFSNEKEKEGIENIINKFVNILKKYDIHEVEYEEFNPNYHVVIQTAQKEGIEKGKIIDVQLRGYKIGDKLLRDAMVIVAE